MNIAIIRLSSLGDIIFSANVANRIKLIDKNCVITWITDESFAPLLTNNPNIDNIVTINLREFKKSKKLSLLKNDIAKLKSLDEFDYIIDLQGLLKSALVSRLLKGVRCGFDYKSAREPIASFFYDKKIKADYNLNVADRYALLLTQLFGQSLKTSEKSLYPSKEFEDTKNAVLINVGASKANKRYPHFRQVIEGLENYNVLLLAGTEEEFDIANTLAQNTNALVLPKLNLEELKNAISCARLVIGGDSGVTHMAWALNVPSIILFGATPSKRNCIQTDINKVIDANLTIDAKKLDYNNFAIANISPDEIIQTAKQLLHA